MSLLFKSCHNCGGAGLQQLIQCQDSACSWHTVPLCCHHGHRTRQHIQWIFTHSTQLSRIGLVSPPARASDLLLVHCHGL